MKELTCFVIGLVVGGLLVQKSKEVEVLEKELDRERARGNGSELKEAH
ncbi:hypothetical protein SAMN04244579_02043 [Azotobacter beijerinckii]|uniref:Uncharacterized protein n=1 Tax=Azotobacter beijerinckii TaxID=170623 RepID=A0A1H6TGB0_9GAMM|nr:hypothetical protein [Azotobacter beijerinckii]SEI79068.1 hypothetical protein SAMN04244579_02043 [Azotobacter beijerinckii]